MSSGHFTLPLRMKEWRHTTAGLHLTFSKGNQTSSCEVLLPAASSRKVVKLTAVVSITYVIFYNQVVNLMHKPSTRRLLCLVSICWPFQHCWPCQELHFSYLSLPGHRKTQVFPPCYWATVSKGIMDGKNDVDSIGISLTDQQIDSFEWLNTWLHSFLLKTTPKCRPGNNSSKWQI